MARALVRRGLVRPALHLEQAAAQPALDLGLLDLGLGLAQAVAQQALDLGLGLEQAVAQQTLDLHLSQGQGP